MASPPMASALAFVNVSGKGEAQLEDAFRAGLPVEGKIEKVVKS